MGAQPYDFDSLLQHRGLVEGLARQLVYDSHQADDISQETWLAALRRPPKGERAPGWLATVVRNFAKQQARSESRRDA